MNEMDESWTGFSIPDLWAPSKYTQQDDDTSKLLFPPLKFEDLDSDLHIPDFVQPEPSSDDPIEGIFNLPDFSLDDDGDTTLANTPSLTDESVRHDDGSDDSYMWELAAAEVHEAPKLLTWQAFEAEKEDQGQTCYISEAPSAAFDAALTQPDLLSVDNSEAILFDTSSYAISLLALGLGRASIFFSYDESSQKFKPTVEKARVSGCSAELVKDVTNIFLECGNYTKEIEHFMEEVYKAGPNSTPARIALAESLSTALQTVQSHLTMNPRTIKSILHLHSLFSPVLDLLSNVSDLLQNIKPAKSDEDVLSILYSHIQKQEHKTDGTYTILLSILSRVSHPFLQFVGEWTGLQKEAGLPYTKAAPGKSWSKSFVKAEERVWIDDQGASIHTPDFTLDETRVPSFIPKEDVETMFEAGRNLRFIREHHPAHALVNQRVVGEVERPKIQWEFKWQGIAGVERGVREYEGKLRRAVAQYSTATENSTPTLAVELPTAQFEELSIFGKSTEDMEAFFTTSLFPTALPTIAQPVEDELSTLITKHLTNTSTSQDNSSSFPPPLSLLPSLWLSPILTTQSRILNHITLTLLFTAHDLREHLRVQRQFQLLGNGLFSTRLSHALFAPELETAERVKGVARTGGVMGLRLGGGRKQWPPASSELRLSLMGIMAECCSPPKSAKQEEKNKGRGGEVELPGDLSFGIRDLSQKEIDKCISPDSIEALDFLRLSYKAPTALQGVMSPAVLGMYDRGFRLLLRQMRISYVVQSLWSQGRNLYQSERWHAHKGRSAGRRKVERFRIEAHHFVSTVAGYFFDVGIDSPWRIFQAKISEVEDLIAKDAHEKFGENDGIEGLRVYHEKVLQRIMGGCLLRKRQKPVMGVLEEIWGFVMQFEIKMRDAGNGSESDEDIEKEIGELYDKFAKKVGVFLTVLRGMGEKIGSGRKEVSGARKGLFDGSELEGDAGSEVRILVERLEMSGYYAVR